MVELAMEFKTWIEVSFERMQTFKALELPDVFTTDPGAGRIRVVEQSEINSAALHLWNQEQPTLAILPTSRPLVSSHSDVHVVPYSDHCSYKELEDFVCALKPTTVVPIVGKYVPGSLSALVPRRKRHEFLVPESVRHYMCRQFDNQPIPSASNGLSRRHFQSVAPQGVIFESPARGSRKSCDEAWEEECLEQNDLEEEMDTESSEKDSDCIIIDLSMDLVPENHREGAGNSWSINIANTVPEDEAPAESVPYTPNEILTNAKVCLVPVRSTRKPSKTSTKTLKEAAANHTGQQSRHGRARYSYTMSDSDGVSQQSSHGIDQEYSDSDSTSQHSGHDQNNRARSSFDNVSCASLSSLTVLRQDYVERIENSILDDLPFTELDLKTCALLQQSFVKRFPLCPSSDDTSDR